MKQIASIITVLMTTSLLYGENYQMTPLCEDESEMIYMRTLLMQNEINQIEAQIRSIKDTVDDVSYLNLVYFLKNMRYYLGMPIDMEDMEFPRG